MVWPHLMNAVCIYTECILILLANGPKTKLHPLTILPLSISSRIFRVDWTFAYIVMTESYNLSLKWSRNGPLCSTTKHIYAKIRQDFQLSLIYYLREDLSTNMITKLSKECFRTIIWNLYWKNFCRLWLFLMELPNTRSKRR